MKLLLWLLLLHQCRLTRQQRPLRALLQALRQSIAVNCRPALCATCPSACNYKWMYMHALKHWGWQAYCDAVEVSFVGSVVYVVEGKCMAMMDGLTHKKKKRIYLPVQYYQPLRLPLTTSVILSYHHRSLRLPLAALVILSYHHRLLRLPLTASRVTRTYSFAFINST